ncbi:MAG: putative photosynthetic complex assembly protein PuhE, partial [Shimia sp.]
VAVRDGVDAPAIYLGFGAALALWGWIEMAFLCGVVSGWHRRIATDATGWRRAWEAFGVVAWHEVLLLAGLGALVWIGWGAANPMPTLTYGVLYLARVLAKLNLFLGVPGFNLEAVPAALAHVPSHFRRADPSWLFPVTIAVLGGLTAAMIAQMMAATGAAAIAFALLTALSALALFEHWMMLLPMADTKLWRWIVPPSNEKTERQGV